MIEENIYPHLNKEAKHIIGTAISVGLRRAWFIHRHTTGHELDIILLTGLTGVVFQSYPRLQKAAIGEHIAQSQRNSS